jgi:hypothetical protein
LLTPILSPAPQTNNPSFDILIATREGTQPIWHSIAAVPAGSIEPYRRSPPLGRNAGSPQRFSCVATEALRDAVLYLRATVKALDLWHTQASSAPTLALLIHMRMIAQHSLLMQYTKRSAIGRSTNASHALRINNDHHHHHPQTPAHPTNWRLPTDAIVHAAALLASDLLTFVLPPTSGARARLLHELTTALQTSPSQTSASDAHANLRIWATMLLAIGAITAPSPISPHITPQNPPQTRNDTDTTLLFAVHTLASQTTPLDFLVLKRDVLCGFLWWDFVLDEPGRDVWNLVGAARERGA